MASWFRAAEELFEVVDRRAKQVTDDILVGQNSAPDFGVFGRVLSTSPLIKAQISSGKAVEGSHDFSLQENGSQGNALLRSASHVPSLVTPEADSLPVTLGSESPTQASNPGQSISHDDKPKTDRIEEGELEKEATASQGIGESLNATCVNSVQEADSENLEPVKCRLLTDDGTTTVELVVEDASMSGNLEVKEFDGYLESKSELSDKSVGYPSTPTSKTVQDKSVDDNFQKNTLASNEDKAPITPKIEEQLDEAQGLLRTAVSTGQSKEARLVRVCAGLSSRLQEYKNENGQLEALLQKEKEEVSALKLQVAQMQTEVASARASASLAESEMLAALSSKNAEIDVLLSSLESAKKQAALLEGRLAATQANMEVLARSRDLTESGMIQTLKEALETAERRAEEEHTAHIATRKAAVQRESELEQCVADTTAALSRMQRMLDERTQRTSELEHKIATLELDSAKLNQELQDMEQKMRREQKRQPEEAAQLQAWREDAHRARESLKDSEVKNLALEAENQKLRVELAGLKREADQLTTQAHLELEKRFRDLTEVLYLKQTQLEAMASEKAAVIFQLEKELHKTREAQDEAERHKRKRNLNFSWEDENEMKTLESLSLQKKPLVGRSIQRAAKLLDTGSVTAGRFLWRRPLARLGVFFYLVFVHAFLLYLLHRLQEQAARLMTSREDMEAAAAAGLVKRGL